MRLIRYIENQGILCYHGGASKVSRFRPGILFLAYDEEEAEQFGKGIHMFGSHRKSAYLYTVEAKMGQTAISDNIITDFIMEEDNPEIEKIGYESSDLDEWILKYYAPYLRKKRYRYFNFSHPSAIGGGDFDVLVSLYPDKDLTIIDVERI